MRGLPIALAALAFNGMTGCGHAKLEHVERFHLHGVVQSLDPSANSATIKHQEIKGFMGAMTMEFPIKPAEDFQKVHVGETVDATVFVQDTDVWIGEIQEGK